MEEAVSMEFHEIVNKIADEKRKLWEQLMEKDGDIVKIVAADLMVTLSQVPVIISAMRESPPRRSDKDGGGKTNYIG